VTLRLQGKGEKAHDYACMRRLNRYVGEMHDNKGKRTVRQPAAPSFGYAEVEQALAKLYDAEDVQREAFRGRLKHFRKLRIPQQQPGKGSRIRYTASDIFQLMVACEFAEFGIDPHLIADILRRHWRHKLGLFQAVDLAQRFSGDDLYVAAETHFMSWVWNREWSKHTATEISVGVTAEPIRIVFFKASDRSVYLKELEEGRRFFVFNLSARVRALEQALMSGRE
jgi:hypothetical protein